MEAQTDSILSLCLPSVEANSRHGVGDVCLFSSSIIYHYDCYDYKLISRSGDSYNCK